MSFFSQHFWIEIRFSSSLYQEIDAMYADMRNLRHDYNTNIIALQAMIEEKEIDQALDFIDQITHEPEKVKHVYIGIVMASGLGIISFSMFCAWVKTLYFN